MSQQKKEPTKENIWNSILSETGQQKKFQNKQVLFLGSKNAGKRTLVDSLHGPSSTQYPKVKQNETHSGLLRIAGSASALDYVYLNVKNLDDSDEDTLAKLSVYIMDDEAHKDLLPIVMKQNTVQDTIVVIVLDLQEPWVFMEQLEKWVDVIAKHLESLQLSLSTLDEMRSKVEKRIREYKDPSAKKPEQISTPEEEAELKKIKNSLPLPEGVLKSNLGIPILVVANKSDVLLDSGDYQLNQSILLSLRKFCLTYGASLIYSSSKSKENLDILYEYILHTAYDFELHHKEETNNLDSVFVPAGVDNLNLIKMSNPQFDHTKSYEELVKKPASKIARKEEETCEDEQEFLKNLLLEKSNPDAVQQLSSKFPSAAPTSASSILRSSTTVISAANAIASTTSGSGSSTSKNNTKVADFYKDLLNRPDNKTLRQNAEKDLLSKMGSSTSSSSSVFRNEEIEQVKDLIKKKN